ncbi:MAG: hypothetical protein PVH19_03115 [Planctomycetia bacterium]|jgi:hypothetical protein
MADHNCDDWSEEMPEWIKDKPEIEGNLEVSKSVDGIFIGGDPEGLRSLGNLLVWLANLDQTIVPGMPDGERYHVHLRPYFSEELQGLLTPFSDTTELCRLDAKGVGEFPKKYNKAWKDCDSEKLKRLRELELEDIEMPDYVELVYAVCAGHKEACGWGGWTIDAAFKITGKRHPTGTGDKVLPANMHPKCPACGKPLYATAESIRFIKEVTES